MLGTGFARMPEPPELPDGCAALRVYQPPLSSCPRKWSRPVTDMFMSAILSLSLFLFPSHAGVGCVLHL